MPDEIQGGDSRGTDDPALSPTSVTASPNNPPTYPGRFPLSVGIDMSKRATADETIAGKMTGTHIGVLLANQDKSDKRAFVESLVERISRLVVVLVALGVVGLICYWTIRDRQYAIAEKIIIAFLSFAGGYGARGFMEKRPKSPD